MLVGVLKVVRRKPSFKKKGFEGYQIVILLQIQAMDMCINRTEYLSSS